MRREAWNRKNERKLAYAVALSLACASFCFGVFAPPSAALAADVAADALPTGGKVVAGEAAIGAAEAVDGRHQLTIDQTSNRAIIDWQTFNVGNDAAVAFQTWTRDATGARIADPTAMTLNRVVGQELSTIAGRITSTGIFLLTNPNGVLFADGASVDAAGIVVSTAALDAKTFQNDGRLVFVQKKNAADAAIAVNGTLVAKTDNAQAEAALANAVVNIGHPVGTTLSTENNVIRIVADGDITVGANGRMQATATAAHTDGATGETARREGTVVLRTDADADESGTVEMEASAAPQITATHAVVQFEPEKAASGQKDYAAGGTRAHEILQHIASSDAVVAMLVNNTTQLQAMNNHLGSSYALGRDIFAQETTTWNKGAGFAPVGSKDAPFTGTFDGNGYRVYDLTIQRAKEDNVGLFGVTRGARIADTTLVDARIRGQDKTGGIVGWATDGTLLHGDVVRKRDGSASEGAPQNGTEADIKGNGSVGGLVGRLMNSTIDGFSQNASAVSGESSVGGLAGKAESSFLYDSSNTGYTSGTVNLETQPGVGAIQAATGWVGGLVGMATGTVIASRDARTATYNAGSILGGMNAGGLVGYLDGGKIQQAYNTNVPLTGAGTAVNVTSAASPYGAVTGTTNVGGLAGYALKGGTITTAFNAGNVTGGKEVGGLVGLAGSAAGGVTVTQAYSADTNTMAAGTDGRAAFAYRDAQVAGADDVGGLVGHLVNGNITQAYSLSRVTHPQGTAGTAMGLLVGAQEKAGTTGTKAEPVYCLRPSDTETAGALHPIGTKAKKWMDDAVEARTMEAFLSADAITWPSGTWLVKDGAPPLLRALPRPVAPPAVPGSTTPGGGSFGFDGFDASLERPYEFVIRDHRGLPSFGGARRETLEALGMQPLAGGRMLMAPLPGIVLEKAEDPQEKAGNETFDSE